MSAASVMDRWNKCSFCVDGTLNMFSLIEEKMTVVTRRQATIVKVKPLKSIKESPSSLVQTRLETRPKTDKPQAFFLSQIFEISHPGPFLTAIEKLISRNTYPSISKGSGDLEIRQV
jgi:hypothetical protein